MRNVRKIFLMIANVFNNFLHVYVHLVKPKQGTEMDKHLCVFMYAIHVNFLLISLGLICIFYTLVYFFLSNKITISKAAIQYLQ